VDAVGADGERHIGAVIDEEPRSTAGRRFPQRPGHREKLAGAQVLLPKLDGSQAHGEAFLHGFLEPTRHHGAIGDETERKP
jgi:hypothetical protein